MKTLESIRQTAKQARHRWHDVLTALSIEVPVLPTHHAPCPACGGKDRFRFDNLEGKGTYICNQCGVGDGLDLVMKTKSCNAKEAAKLVAGTLNLPVIAPATKRTAAAVPFATDYARMLSLSAPGESEYLKRKGLNGFSYPILAAGQILLALADSSGQISAAQVIQPTGVKRLLRGSVKKGAFYVVPCEQETPQTVILAEGLATALSASQMRPDALCVVAVDAGNLLPVAEIMRSKYPQAKIILAADNDISPDKTNTGKLAADKAAAAVSGWVALPPTLEKADWDDCRQRHGIEQCASLFNASLYQPQDSAMKKASPLKPYAALRQEGLYWIEPRTDSYSGELIERESWLSDPLEVIGMGASEAERYLILKAIPAGGTATHTEAMPMSEIGERDGWARLRRSGVRMTAKSSLRAILADHLSQSETAQRWSISDSTGWQCGAYLMPDGSVIGAPASPVLFNGKSSAAKGYGIKGTPESWRDSVAALARGNPSMMLAMGCALTAPLIGLVGADGFGVHLFGGSSSGKTTTGNAATSLYGEPEALKLTWYSTALGLINEAAAHNDGFMPLDEIGQGSNRRAVAESAYALFNGVGKIQGAKEGGNRDLKRWRAMAFSTGETDLESYLSAEGSKINAGQLVRLLNVPISKATQFHAYADGQAHAAAMRDACNANFGAAGRAWIAHLASQKEAAIDGAKHYERQWLAGLDRAAGEQVRRVAVRFSLLETALVLAESFTGWTAQESHDALQHSFNAWISEFGTGNREKKAYIDQAQGFLQRNGHSRYLPHPNSDPRDMPLKELAGYRGTRMTDSKTVFYTFPAVFREEIAKGYNPTAFAQVLAEVGMMEMPLKPQKGLTKKSIRVDGTQPNFVVLMMLEDWE
ncbi:DNA primase [Rahnella variigena]|uniref:TOPRIM and DUF927 domain-containing protein n=1 Tax=Rahnella variigena TaxID=574964 RepID=UPI00101BDCE6|nr:TOPRIM and DUF927 domain-containing protein [Rahnella variigena]RYJ18295.1 DNA primase [Rahnella variigena]